VDSSKRATSSPTTVCNNREQPFSETFKLDKETKNTVRYAEEVEGRSIVVPLLLVALGVLFLYTNLRPEANPWPLVSCWWAARQISQVLAQV
jgi:hypothetical protein